MMFPPLSCINELPCGTWIEASAPCGVYVTSTLPVAVSQICTFWLESARRVPCGAQLSQALAESCPKALATFPFDASSNLMSSPLNAMYFPLEDQPMDQKSPAKGVPAGG